ncbi:o-succinylbenzoate--CoA ligase [Bacillus sp. FSL W8-1127]|uniref:o-succinylbenzoate--CoA ligase n=1 Tax=Bacillus sp. FSL W8-1127 TaxID=2954710 RepID=UPI0030F69DC8
MAAVLPNFLKQRASLTPDRPAVLFHDQSYTFQDVFEKALKFAGKIASYSISSGDAVALLVKNKPESIFIIYALQQLGAVAVMINTRLTESEISWQITDSEAKLLIYDDEFKDTADRVQNQKGNLEKASIDELKEREPRLTFIAEEWKMDHICSIMYTSGTTGNPKGVLQSYENHFWSAAGSALNLGLKEDDLWICAVPLFHISGYSILMRSIIYGMTVRLYERFDEEDINNKLINGEGTIISVVTVMLQRLLNNLGNKSYSSRFRCMLLGGGPAPKSILEQCSEKGIPIFQTYGMTETSSQIVTLPPEYSLSKLGSAGKPLFPAQIRIMEDGKVLPPLKAGEIVVKGPNVTKGYLKREDANRERFQDGWLFTGDIGYLDEEGFLYVLDRRSDLIISGGENIYPAEIESVLTGHPDVVEAGVIGVNDANWGQVPVAFLVVKKNVPEKELLDYCRMHLAKYKIPRRFFTVPALPRNASNKLLRRELKQLYREMMKKNAQNSDE